MHAVVFNSALDEGLTLVGTFVFAMSGALLAVRKNYDVVGMTVLAAITATGGGIVRDLVLGAVPPAAFTDHVSFLLPLGAVLLTFFAHRQINRVEFAVLVFDAAGLAVFCVSGAAKALAFGMGPIGAVALGALTGVGGGIMRDVLAAERPAVLRADSELYAVPAVLGALIVVALQRLHLFSSLAAGLVAVFVFVLRLVALRYRVRAPYAKAAPDEFLRAPDGAAPRRKGGPPGGERQPSGVWQVRMVQWRREGGERMSHAVMIPDELYRAIEEYAARRGESAEAAILAWAESLTKGPERATRTAQPEASSRINDPAYDPWAGFRGVAELRSADSLDRHDAYLAEEYTKTHEPER